MSKYSQGNITELNQSNLRLHAVKDPKIYTAIV